MSDPSPHATPSLNALLKLERTLELHCAIERIEAIASQQAEQSAVSSQQRDEPQSQQDGAASRDDSSFAQDLSDLASSPSSPPTQPALELSDNNALIIPPHRRPLWHHDAQALLQSEVEHHIRMALHRLEHEARPRSRAGRPVLPFLQLTAAVIFGVTLYVGIAGWVHMERQSTSTPAHAAAPNPAAAAAVSARGTSPEAATSEPEPSSPFAFPLPKSFGIYAGSGDKLIELERLPIKIPDMRVLVSAEITDPSRAIVPNGDVTFIVFRRDLVASAPATASVRVVARVSRAMKFVDGKPTYTTLQGSWRVRAKAYEYKVSPVEGRREMIVIRPDAKRPLSPGRYALVLNGYGYDFTIPGKVTSTEHCLEQVQVMNGIVVSECPAT